jgi:Zn-finger nucleic acid-binding protein
MAGRPGAKKRRECPKCESRLVERRIKDTLVTVDCCPSCRGMWFDNREIETVLKLEARERFVPRDAEKSDRHCPGCNVLLYRFRYPETDVEIDMCEGCHGIWLDSGELRGLEEMYAGRKWAFLRFMEKALGA